MNKEQLIAALKSAAWGLAALVGYQKAADILNRMAAELKSEDWGR